MMHIGIIGAGMAGLSCAQFLTEAGHKVRLFDKGRGAGGRMSTRRIATSVGEATFDHGAQYFNVRDAQFRRQTALWRDAGLVAPWPSAGPEAYVGVPTMNAPLRDMANRQSVQWSSLVVNITRREPGWTLFLEAGEAVDVDLVVVATPAEQAGCLLGDVAQQFAARARAAHSAPCWTLMLAFHQTLDVGEDCWRGTDAVGWAARNRAKPGRSGPESWVVQAGPNWSRRYLEADPDWIATTLTEAFCTLIGASLPTVASLSVHRWRYARSGADGAGMMFDPALRLGVCGDWLIGPRVEAAWISGMKLANAIVAPDVREQTSFPPRNAAISDCSTETAFSTPHCSTTRP